jgi:hypothetical protein
LACALRSTEILPISSVTNFRNSALFFRKGKSNQTRTSPSSLAVSALYLRAKRAQRNS